jgi:hypothetical protein
MKKNSISIRIEQPCREDWDQMTPTATGKFCAACEKNVTDFTSMTDNEILSFLENHTGKLCGQLRGSQLNRVIVQTKLQGRNYRLNAFFAALLFAGGAGSLMAQAPAQPPYIPNVVIEKHPTGPVCIKVPETKEKLVLKAALVDTLLNQNVASAVIQIAGTNSGAETDEHGNFVLEIPDSLAGDSVTLWCYNPGYFRQTVTIAVKDISSTSAVRVAFNEIMMKGEMIVEPKPRKCGND